jgi:hypothetical protein
MNVPDWLQGLSDQTWHGTSGLWMEPGTPGFRSETTATVRLVANGIAAAIEYSWSFEGATQEGILIIGISDDGSAEASWIDSFHMSAEFMLSKGSVSRDDSLSVLGHWSAGDGPPWGWRTEIAKQSNAAWQVRMYVIPPGEDEALGFELSFSA